MSGGHFGFNQYHLGDIADSIEREIERATGPKPPLVTKECVSVCRVVSDSCKSYLSYHYPTFNSALRDFMRPEDYEVLVRTDNMVRVKGKGDGQIYEVHHGTYEEYEDGGSYPNYTEETIKEFRNAIDILRRAEIYAQRVDYLISGDDGEESFHSRLKEELKKYEEQTQKGK
jgi:hypothetical protein